MSQRSSDDEEHGARSPPLEVSDEECQRDRVSYMTPGELGKDKDLQRVQLFTEQTTRTLEDVRAAVAM